MLQVKIVTTIKKSSLWPSTGTSFCISIIFQKYNTDRNCTTSTSTIYISSTFSMNISGQCRTFTLWYSRNFTCIKDSNTTSVTELKLDNLYIIHCQLKNNLRHNKKKKKGNYEDVNAATQTHICSALPGIHIGLCAFTNTDIKASS